jgi:hypothetical protein
VAVMAMRIMRTATFRYFVGFHFRLGEPQDDVAEALARPSHRAEPIRSAIAWRPT